MKLFNLNDINKGNGFFTEKEIMYIMYFRTPIGVLGHQCEKIVKNCEQCSLIKCCYPLILDAPKEYTPEEETK